jgi:hypothetical protein
MKQLSSIILLFTVLSFTLCVDMTDEIVAAINSGNSKEVSKYFGDTVDMKILDQEGVYSRAQAELILKDFLAKHPVKKCTLAHQSAKSDSQYAIVTLITSNGQFRVFFLSKKTANKLTIQQFRIETNE